MDLFSSHDLPCMVGILSLGTLDPANWLSSQTLHVNAIFLPRCNLKVCHQLNSSSLDLAERKCRQMPVSRKTPVHLDGKTRCISPGSWLLSRYRELKISTKPGKHLKF
jgi:hypothetical protein